jgi:hypothetical protein
LVSSVCVGGKTILMVIAARMIDNSQLAGVRRVKQ